MYSIDGSAALADALVDVWGLTDDGRYRDAARDALSTFGGARERFGPEAAGFATAVARIAGPLRIEVAAPAGPALNRAALRVADHEKLVLPDASGPSAGSAVAVVVDSRTETAETPEELVGRLDGRVP